jgi:hypothetical protein
LPPHKLNPEEYGFVETILRDAAESEYFDLSSLHTSILRGEKILIAEGFWKLSTLDSYAVFIDSDENGDCRIDEIYYLAPREKFAAHLPEFRNTLDSIQW